MPNRKGFKRKREVGKYGMILNRIMFQDGEHTVSRRTKKKHKLLWRLIKIKILILIRSKSRVWRNSWPNKSRRWTQWETKLLEKE